MKKILRGRRFQTDPDSKNTPTNSSLTPQSSLEQKNDRFVAVEESKITPLLPHDSISFRN